MSRPNMLSQFANLAPDKLHQLQSELTNILTEEEKRLPDDKRNELFRAKMFGLMQQQQQLQQQQQQQAGMQGAQGVQGNQHQLQQQQLQLQMQMQQKNAMAGMQQGQGAGSGSMGMQQKPQMNQQNQTAYQEQLRLQIQAQQQQHVAAMVEKSQRMQQQQAAAQNRQPTPKAQPMTPIPLTQGSMAGASPGSHIGSPQVVRQSPNAGPGRPNVGGMNMQGIKTLIENFPKLLELKRLGKLKPEQEKLFDSFIGSPEGQSHFQQFQAHQARALVERGLSNPVTLPPGVQPPQGTPMLNGMPLPLAAQQQMAALQQQQQQQQQQQHVNAAAQGGQFQHATHALQAQLQQQFPQGLVPQTHGTPQPPQQGQQPQAGQGQGQQGMGTPQFTPQQIQQIQLQRIAAAQAQAQGQRPPGQMQGQHSQRPGIGAGNMAGMTQAQAQAVLARAQQQQQQGMIGMNGAVGGQHLPGQSIQRRLSQAAIGQQGQGQGQGQAGFGSPRPRPQVSIQQMLQNIQSMLGRVAPDKQDNVKAMVVRLANMSEEERNASFANSPHLLPLWNRAIAAPATQSQIQAAQAQAVQAQQLQQAQAQASAQAQAQAAQAVQAHAQAHAQAAAAAQANLGASSPHIAGIHGSGNATGGIGSGGTPIMRPGSSAGFTLQTNVPNLHIPANKQRNMSQSGMSGASPRQGSVGHAQGTAPGQGTPNGQEMQVQPGQGQPGVPHGADHSMVQRMLDQGIPVQQHPTHPSAAQAQALALTQAAALQRHAQLGLVNTSGPPGPNGMFHPSQITGINNSITPAQMLESFGAGQPRPPQPSPDIMRTHENVVPTDRAGSKLDMAIYVPTAESDAKLRERLFAPRAGVGGGGLSRGTLRGDRVLGDAVLDELPEGLKAVLDEEAVEEIEEGAGAMSSAGAGSAGTGRTSGMPGQKKRKVQEIAEEVDKALRVPQEPESILLEIFDEHCDVVSESSCMLAKHRRATTVDRKDIQLSLELLDGRVLPGFSSDRIRLDQSRSSRSRAANPQYVNKARLVAEAKIAWRREKKEKSLAAVSGLDGEGDVVMV